MPIKKANQNSLKLVETYIVLINLNLINSKLESISVRKSIVSHLRPDFKQATVSLALYKPSGTTIGNNTWSKYMGQHRYGPYGII